MNKRVTNKFQFGEKQDSEQEKHVYKKIKIGMWSNFKRWVVKELTKDIL